MKINILGAALLSLLLSSAALADEANSIQPVINAAFSALPGAEKPGEKLRERYRTLKALRAESYKPRTKHLQPDGWAKFTNRLFLETSPYLLQHAHNPVNWYPWGDEAFERARELGRPVLLSIGYSTCHWCHVMEEESFEDLEIAKYMNENYVAIKIDREERPDIDAIYMSAVQAITGRGGWPMTVWLTPDRKPYFGGTYFPPRDGVRGTRTGFLTLLRKLKQAYDSDRNRVVQTGTALVKLLEQRLSPAGGENIPGVETIQKVTAYVKRAFDSNYGGFRQAPKFPGSMPVRLLFRHYRRSGDEQALKYATRTLEKMAAGGMYDHVGGGFHRYSTDRKWLVPHFEKMLYDNALLAGAYLEGYQVTRNNDFRRVTTEILEYVLRDMASPEGAFYSATDADSLNPEGHREEGWFFTWTPEEIDAVLSTQSAKLIKAYYAVAPTGNFEGRNILHTPVPLDAVAKEQGLSVKEARALVDDARKKLYHARKKRHPPIRDEKILTAWNGLMISAFASSGLILNEPRYIEAAERAAEFVRKNLYENGRLYRSYKDGQAKFNGYLEDYSFYINGLLDLYEATGALKWLTFAIDLDRVVKSHYEDHEKGGFFTTSDDHEKLLAREKPAYDGAEPSGGSRAVLTLLRFHEFTTDDDYRKRAEKALRFYSSVLEQNPLALSELLLAVDFHADKPKEIIIITPEQKKDTAEPFLAEFRRIFLPNRILAVVSEGPEIEKQAVTIPLLKGKQAIRGQVTAYVCEQGICELPALDVQTFSSQIVRAEAEN